MKHMLRFASAALIVSACVVLVGCSRKPAVEGKISVRGTPLNAGTVTFRSGEVVRGATIRRDGTYEIPDCPPGKYTVTVEVPTFKFAKNSGAVPKAAPMPGKVEPSDPTPPPVAVDARYRDATQSGLSFTVSPDNRNIDIELR
jgi:hypothetical protein